MLDVLDWLVHFFCLLELRVNFCTGCVLLKRPSIGHIHNVGSVADTEMYNLSDFYQVFDKSPFVAQE